MKSYIFHRYLWIIKNYPTNSPGKALLWSNCTLVDSGSSIKSKGVFAIWIYSTLTRFLTVFCFASISFISTTLVVVMVIFLLLFCISFHLFLSVSSDFLFSVFICFYCLYLFSVSICFISFYLFLSVFICFYHHRMLLNASIYLCIQAWMLIRFHLKM